eukprot:1148854-Pelagomonas_calceolata.AAC.1
MHALMLAAHVHVIRKGSSEDCEDLKRLTLLPSSYELQQPTAAPAQPTSQGVLPALFGFQLGPGQGYVEALTPEQQHQCSKLKVCTAESPAYGVGVMVKQGWGRSLNVPIGSGELREY